MAINAAVKQSIQNEARRLGFTLAGVTSPEPPPHLATFENWIAEGRHGSMDYLGNESARARRADARSILPECKSILVLAIPYSPPLPPPISDHSQRDGTGAEAEMGGQEGGRGRVAAYAWGDDYHIVLPGRMKQLVSFIEQQVGHAIPNRCYTDSGPILERDLAQRAGLGWIGKNTCLIHPRHGSYFLLAEILLGLELEPDPPFMTDHCGTCTRCIDACPTNCILPDRTLDARRCISYLTIELKDGISPELQPMIGDWVFGCDICQAVCPWNRFSDPAGDPAFAPREGIPLPVLTAELSLTQDEFSRKFKNSPLKRARRRGYLRNVAVALANQGRSESIPALQAALDNDEALVREQAVSSLETIQKQGAKTNGRLPDRTA
ncbi:MAG TPA: tRNA epoxyqueuosine(34) reductase QueG [Anaerolineales bacterium]